MSSSDALQTPKQVTLKIEAADRLTEIQQRADAATDGPWAAHWWGIESESVDVLVIQDDYESSRQDFEFIAHAREDIPFLLAELARYQAAVRAVRQFADKHEHGALRWEDPLPVPEWIPPLRDVLAEHLGEAE